MRVGLLECDVIAEPFVGIAGPMAALFANLLAASLPQAELVSYDMYRRQGPASADECDAWICTGSRASAYDDEPWIAELTEFVAGTHATGSPLVGICFGHQVLARALGGVVERAPGGWGAGVHQLDMVDERPWMRPEVAKPNLLFMHQDQVTTLPAGATLLAATDHCPIAMFEAGSAVGLQAHPEFSAAYISALLVDRIERIGATRAAEAQASLTTSTDHAEVGRWVGAFLQSGAS